RTRARAPKRPKPRGCAEIALRESLTYTPPDEFPRDVGPKRTPPWRIAKKAAWFSRRLIDSPLRCSVGGAPQFIERARGFFTPPLRKTPETSHFRAIPHDATRRSG